MSTDILIICTGNVCRSPMAELLLTRALARRDPGAVVRSAGLVTEDLPAAPEVVELLDEWGIDGRGHRSRRLGAPDVEAADLVVGMAREHAREAVLLAPERAGRAFTLKELVRRGRAAGARVPGEPLAAWLARAGAGRRPADLLGVEPADDVADPVGRRMAVFRRVAAEIDEQVTALVELAWPYEGET